MGLIEVESNSDDPASTSDIGEMNAFLRQHQGKPMALWHYHVSHSEVELRLRHSGEINDIWEEESSADEEWLNTLIYCSFTRSIKFPTLRWSCELKIEEIESDLSAFIDRPLYYLLADPSAGIEIECQSVIMYFDILPGL